MRPLRAHVARSGDNSADKARVHPVSSRKVLFVNPWFTLGIDGMAATGRTDAYCGLIPVARNRGGHLRSSAAKNSANSAGVAILAS